MAATNFTPIQLYFSTTASAVPLAANLAQGELAINITDGKLYYEDNGGVVQVIATKGAGSIGGSTTQIQYNNAGALAGNAAMTFDSGTNVTALTTLNLTNALGAIYGGTAQSAYTQGDFLYASATNTLSKLGIGTVNYILTSTGSVPQWSAPSSIIVQTATNLAGGLAGSVPYQSALDTTTFLSIGAANRVMTSTGSAPQWVTSLTGLTGVSSSSITNTSLTSGRVVVSSTAGLQADDADLTFDGTTLSAGGFSTVGLSTLVKTVNIGDSSFSGVAVFAAATPAKLYMGTGTVTDVTSAISATNTTGAIASLDITPIAATNTGVTYTNASTLYIAGAPSAGTNITITNPYALYVAAGDAYFGGTVTAGTVNLTTLDLTNLEVTNIKAKDGTASIALANTTGIATFSNATVISVTDNTNAALRITQLGTGNALLVEDTTNPDATPFVVDASGNVTIGNLVPATGYGQLQVVTSSALASALIQLDSNANPSILSFLKTRGAVPSAQTVVQSGDQIGQLRFYGSDGTTYIRNAAITAEIDGTPGTNDMPGRLVFSTTADGASSPTERMRISSTGQTTISGNAIISVTDNTNAALRITQLGTGNALLVEDTTNPDATPFVVNASGDVIIGTTTALTSNSGIIPKLQQHGLSNDASAFSINDWQTSGFGGPYVNLNKSKSGAIGTRGIVALNDRLGFLNWSGDDGAAFIRAAQIEAYVDGTPGVNDMPGRLVFSTTADGASSVTERMRIDSSGNVLVGYTAAITGSSSFVPPLQVSTGNTNSSGVGVNSFSAGSGSGYLHFNRSKSSTIGTNTVVANGDSIGNIVFAGADGTAFIRGAAISAAVDGTPGTNDMPGRLVFSTTADGASSTTERMRIDSAGNVGIGGTPGADVSFIVSKNITGATTAYGIAESGTVQSDVTSAANMFLSNPKTVASAFTVTTLNHYSAVQGAIGATSAVTNQFSFNVASNNTGATNNYGYYSNIAAAANRWNFYANGTARNYMAADLTVNGATAIPAGGTAGAGLMVSTTANFGVFFGSGAPTLSAAKGSLYLRSDGSAVNDRMYVNTNGSTTWTSVVTSA